MQKLKKSTNCTPPSCAELLLDVVPLLMARLRSETHTCRPADLSVPQFRALAFIDRHSGLSLTAVAELLGLTVSATSKLVGAMVQADYLRHEVCTRDRRRARLSVTAKGRATMRRARRIVGKSLEQQFLGLTPEAEQELRRTLLLLQQLFAPPAPEEAPTGAAKRG